MRTGRLPAVRAQPAIDDLGLLHLESASICWREAWRCTHGAVDVLQPTALATEQMVVVVPDPALVESRCTLRADPLHEACAHQGTQGVVHRLPGDSPDVLARGVGETLRRGVRVLSHRFQDREALRRDLQATLAELTRERFVGGWGGSHVGRIRPLWTQSKFGPGLCLCRLPRPLSGMDSQAVFSGRRHSVKGSAGAAGYWLREHIPAAP